jgi:hypothetical protein
MGIWFAIVALAAEPLEWDIPNSAKWMVFATAAPIGAGLIVLRWYLGSRHDPNSQPDVARRKEIGRQRIADDAQSFSVSRPDEETAAAPISPEPVVGVQTGLPADGAGRAEEVIGTSPFPSRDKARCIPLCPPENSALRYPCDGESH